MPGVKYGIDIMNKNLVKTLQRQQLRLSSKNFGVNYGFSTD